MKLDVAMDFEVDGEPVDAKAGETVAVALVRSGRYVFGRSVKYHRPRGPVCFRARCEGCLMRVDGRPNTMTCRTLVKPGMKVTTQNVIGTAEYDLLSLTDWLYPKGIDHHHFWTRFRIPNAIMKAVARRIAGVGRIPDVAVEALAPRRSETDVLVVGAGIAGVTAANAAAKGGARVLLVDEDRFAGGEAQLLRDAGCPAPPLPTIGPPVVRRFGSTAVALFHEDASGEPVGGSVVLLESEGRIEQVHARTVIVATGVTGGALAFEGNDLPGVFTATGALALLGQGIVPRSAVTVGEGPLLAALGAALMRRGVQVVGPLPSAEVRATGNHQVRGVHHSKGTRSYHPSEWVVAGAPPSAALEIAVQGGATTHWNDGFVVEANDEGRTAGAGLFAVGSVTGRRGEAAAEQGRRAGEAAAS
ncbi:MAG: 2Fe-2S iron-sulfur cluster-binding protein [Myxococcota bacterium]